MNKDILNIIFTLFLCIVFGSAAILALGFSRLAQFFPLYVSVAGTILSIIYLIVLLIHYNKNRTEHERISFIKPLRYIGWIVGYIGVIYVFGMFIATSLFILSFCSSNNDGLVENDYLCSMCACRHFHCQQLARRLLANKYSRFLRSDRCERV